jgi:hypothetical protein
MILVGIEASDGVMLGSNPKARKQPMNRAGFMALEMFKWVAVIERQMSDLEKRVMRRGQNRGIDPSRPSLVLLDGVDDCRKPASRL